METPTEQLAASLAGLSLQPSPLSPFTNKAKLESTAGESAVNGVTDAIIDHLRRQIEDLTAEVNRLLTSIYEIEELRHSAGSKGPPSTLPQLVSQLDSDISTIPSRLGAVQDQVQTLQGGSLGSSEIYGLFEGLRQDVTKLATEHSALVVEMKEDGWLSRFRSTADQADSMMDPLQNSVIELLRYVERINTSPVPVPYESELEELPSIRKLQLMAKRHDTMKGTYVLSIAKIIKMMDRSISDRASKSGEALRRFGEMSQRWSTLQKQLQQLDTRIRMVIARHESQTTQQDPSESFNGSSLGVSLGHSSLTPVKPGMKHRSSISSGTSAASSNQTTSTGQYTSPAVSRIGKVDARSYLSPDPTLRRKSSFVSDAAPAVPPQRSISGGVTPTTRRLTSYGRAETASPTPSQVSMTSSIQSKPSGSRIPIASPKSANSSTHAQRPSITSLAVPPARGDRDSMRTPEPQRARPSLGYGSMTAPRPSLGATGPRTSSFGTGPRLSRAPPSSFRSITPTPSAFGGGRPSSRMSVNSYAQSAVAPVNLQPFQPSRYDLLDTTVQGIIEETGFDLFVSRIDPAMKRGQRRSENEEWKGEYVFGAGQKVSPVKLLKLAARTSASATAGDGARTKCLVRVKGQWVDLAGLLRQRLDEMPKQEFLDSP